MRQKKSGAEPGNGETLQTCEFQHLHIKKLSAAEKKKETAETQRTGPYICTYHCACMDEIVHPHHTHTHTLTEQLMKFVTLFFLCVISCYILSESWCIFYIFT